MQDLVVGGGLREVGPRILGEQIERARRADPDALTDLKSRCERCPWLYCHRRTVPNWPLICSIKR